MKKKDLKFKNNVRSLALIALGVITIGTGTTVLASTNWKANTPESINIVEGQNSYTMVEGDTLWAIGMKINVNVETLSAINNINLSNGEEYHLAVGTIIKWDKSGNLIAQTPNGNQVNQGVKVEDSNKIIPSKPIGSDVTGDVIENNIPDDQIQGGNEVEVKPVEPTTPIKPTDPIEPTNPVDPVKPVDPIKPVDPTTPTDPVDPKPPVQKNYTVWYEGRDTNEFDIALGVNLFETKEEARQFIDNYADNLLLEGYAAQSYGTALWENN